MKKLILTITLIIICGLIYSQNLYQKTIQGIGYEKLYGLEETIDGYIVAGVTNSFGAGQKDMLVIRIDNNGDTIWTKTYGGFYNEEAYSVKKTSDGNFIITGYTSSFSNYSNDSANFYILKIDIDGNLLWSKSFGGPGKDIARNMIETTDHNYLIIGSTSSIGAGCTDVYVLKLDSSGNYLWSRSLGSSGCELSTDAIELSDKGIIIIGKTSSFSLEGYIPFVIRTDSIGNSIWAKTYDIPGYYGPKNITSNDLIKGYSNDLLFVGSRGIDPDVGAAQHYIIDIDSLGNLNWAKLYLMNSGNSAGYSIDKTTDGGFIIGGWMGDYYPALLKVDAIGQWLWSWTYSTPPSTTFYYGKGYKTLTTNDGGFLSVGMRYQYGTGDTIAMLMKTDINGNYSCGYSEPTATGSTALNINIASQVFTSSMATIDLIDTCVIGSAPEDIITYCLTVGLSETIYDNNLKIYPNPFNDNLYIFDNDKEIIEITLFDIISRKILQQKFANYATINTEQLKRGVYIYEVRYIKGVIKRGKLIKK